MMELSTVVFGLCSLLRNFYVAVPIKRCTILPIGDFLDLPELNIGN